MKKIITTTLILLSVLIPSFSQNDFRVIKVNGTITLKAKGTSLETGTVFSETEDLLFKSADATAAVINSQKGRLILTSKDHDLTAARPNTLPSMYNLASRSTAATGSDDLADVFAGRYVVLDKQNILINRDTYPMDNDHFFFLRYIFKGEEINKKLSFHMDTLIIDKANLFMVDGNPIPSADNTSIKLYYHKGAESVFINEFDLIFPDMNMLEKEIKIILGEYRNKPAREKIDEVASYINEFYGKVDNESLNKWLKIKFEIK